MREADQQGTPPSEATPMQRAPRPALSWIAVGGALLLFALLARTLTTYPLEPLRFPLGGAASATPTLITTEQNSGVPGLQLNNIVMVSASDGWATGWKSALDGFGSIVQLVLHWDGSNWSSVNDTPTNNSVSALAALPGDYLWMAEDGSIYEYLGGSWYQSYASPTDNVQYGYTDITSIAMLSPSEGWAAGIVGDVDGDSSVLVHCHNGVWTPYPSNALPAGGLSSALQSISMSPDGSEGWAIGSQFTFSGEVPFALHYVNGAWSEADKGLPGAATGVATVDAGDAWAVGVTGSSGPGYIAHWHDGLWQHVASPTTNQLHAITMLGADQGWIAGDGAATLHYLDGAWQREGLVIHGTLLDGISMTAPNEGWAVGGGVLLRDHGGVWSVYHLSL